MRGKKDILRHSMFPGWTSLPSTKPPDLPLSLLTGDEGITDNYYYY